MRRILGLAFAGVTACFGGGDDDVTEPIDAPLDAPIIVDAPVDGSFQCANDSSIEPNDMPQSAFITPLPFQQSYTLVGLAICPSTDVDHYRISVDANFNFEATVQSVAGRNPLAVALVDASGDVIVDGATVVGGMPNVVRLEAVAALISPGTYYVRVRSADGTENNYDLQLKTCDVALPCP
jgi:hypothetical protein